MIIKKNFQALFFVLLFSFHANAGLFYLTPSTQYCSIWDLLMGDAEINSHSQTAFLNKLGNIKIKLNNVPVCVRFTNNHLFTEDTYTPEEQSSEEEYDSNAEKSDYSSIRDSSYDEESEKNFSITDTESFIIDTSLRTTLYLYKYRTNKIILTFDLEVCLFTLDFYDILEKIGRIALANI